MTWKSNFTTGNEIILSTSSIDGVPNANIVISLGFHDTKLLVANCQMTNTFQNLSDTGKICIIGGHYRLKGKVELFTSGKYFDICVKESDGYDVKTAILITITEVFDLDNVKNILI